MSWEQVLEEDDYRFYRENISLLEERVARSFREGYRNPAVLSAIRKVPRHLFVNQGYKTLAYADTALPTCGGLTTSAPSVIARMIAETGVSRGGRLLEIGTGTGYQAAVLAEMGVKVFTIEIDGSAVEAANSILVRLGYKTERHREGLASTAESLRRFAALQRLFPGRGPIRLFHGNGQNGNASESPYNAIIVAASIPDLRHVRMLAGQLSSSGGRMVVPVGDRHDQELAIVERRGKKLQVSCLEGVSFNFLRMVLRTGI
jgi:protein-L-isoaspartate(D-aspartate) O-methyltransferase